VWIDGRTNRRNSKRRRRRIEALHTDTQDVNS